MSERQILMIVGNHSPYVESRSSYGRSLAQLRSAIGNDRMNRLMAGETIVLDRRNRGTRRQGRRPASREDRTP